MTTGFDVFNTARFNFGAAKLAITYGADGFEDKVVTSDPTSNGDELTPSGRRTVMGAFVQGQLKFGTLVEIVSALRYDSYELEGGTTKLDGDRISPKITVGVTPIEGFTVYGTYAEGYRSPSVTETLIDGLHPLPSFPLLPNPNLRPETAATTEAGVNLKYDGIFRPNDAFRAKISIFRNEVEDFISFESVSDFPFPFGSFQYINLGSVTLEGAEFEATYDARNWFVGVAATHIRGTDDATGLGVDSVPADQVVLTGGVRLMDRKLIAGGRVRFVAKQDRVTTASLATDAYNVVDLFSQYIVSDAVTVNLNISNLFDVEYRPHLTQLNDPGFNARLGVTIRLGAK